MEAECRTSSLIMSGMPVLAFSEMVATSLSATLSPAAVVAEEPSTFFNCAFFQAPPTST